MITRLFTTLCSSSPALRRTLWKFWYNFLGGRYQQRDWTFMNYGYEPLDDTEVRPALVEEEEPDRRCIQLYDHLACAVPLEGKWLIEVGSGRGGGCTWIHRRYTPRGTRGVDFSREAVALCRRRHRWKGLSFVQGDAEDLPIQSSRVDVVINVESSHCYGSRERFFQQVARILRPGGVFLYADFFSEEELRDVRDLLAASGFHIERDKDITDNVLRAMELDHDWKQKKIQRILPFGLAGLFEQFAGLKDTRIYNTFRDRDLTYRSFVLKSGIES